MSDITKGIPFEPWSKENCIKSYDRSLCPLCGHKLVKRYEGMVCKNHKCRLYFKLEIGWVLMGDSKRNKSKFMANVFYNSSRRLMLDKLWVEKKQKILIRDNYSCVKCNKELDSWSCNPPLNVHHIIPASKEMALYFDEDNLITLCEDCHKEVHNFDKYKYGTTN